MLLPYKAQPASARLPVLQVDGHSSLSSMGGPCAGCAVHMHTEVLAGRGETYRWMSAAGDALGRPGVG